MPSRSELITSIGDAIATMEGFHKAGSIAQRNNNPGNLRSWGKNPVVGGYAKFSGVDAGWKALYLQIELNIERGLTLQEFFGGKPGIYPGYAPSADRNDPRGYAQYVAGRVGIEPTVPLNSIGNVRSPESQAECLAIHDELIRRIQDDPMTGEQQAVLESFGGWLRQRMGERG